MSLPSMLSTTNDINIGSGQVEGDIKVLESIKVCYCSNFDLNINEWFNEYENIEYYHQSINLINNSSQLTPNLLSIFRLLYQFTN